MSISILNRGTSGGLKPELTVTAPSGSTIDILQSGIIIDTYTLGASETEHTFVVKVGSYIVKGTRGTETKSAGVVIDTVGRYSVEIWYLPYLVKSGIIQSEYEYQKLDSNYQNGSDYFTGSVSYNPLSIWRGGPNYTAVCFKADATKRNKMCLTLSKYVSTDTVNTGDYLKIRLGKATAFQSGYTHLSETTLPRKNSSASFDYNTIITADISNLSGTTYLYIMLHSTSIGASGAITIEDFWLE